MSSLEKELRDEIEWVWNKKTEDQPNTQDETYNINRASSITESSHPYKYLYPTVWHSSCPCGDWRSSREIKNLKTKPKREAQGVEHSGVVKAEEGRK